MSNFNTNNVSSTNLMWHGFETYKALFGNKYSFCDDKKTNETETGQFWGMIRLIHDSLNASETNADVEGPEPVEFVSFSETNPEHNLAHLQCDASEVERDFDDNVERFWCMEENRFVLRDEMYWDANATVQWNTFQDQENDFFDWDEWDDKPGSYMNRLDAFIDRYCG